MSTSAISRRRLGQSIAATSTAVITVSLIATVLVAPASSAKKPVLPGQPTPTATPTATSTATPTPTAEPTAQPIAKLMTGWSATNIARATLFAGVPNATRGPFYGALPTTYQSNAPRFSPDTKTRFVSFSSVTAALETYVKSVPYDVDMKLIFLHEVENGKSGTYDGVLRDYTNDGPAYVADYIKTYDRVKAANPSVQMGMVSASWAYRASGSPAILAGSFLPPASKVDFYAVDTYQEDRTSLQPLQFHAKFQNWFKLVKSRGKTLGITEYAAQFLTPVSLSPFVTQEQAAGESAARAKTIALDAAWIKSTGLFKYWLYWYYSDSKSGDPTYRTREFTDQGTIDAWRKVVADNP